MRAPPRPADLSPCSLSGRRLRHQEPVQSDGGALRRAAGPGGGGPESQPHHQGDAHNSRGQQGDGHQVGGCLHTHTHTLTLLKTEHLTSYKTS